MSETPRPLRVMVSAGEISGDMYAAAIVREMRREYGAVSYFDYTASPRPESVTVLIFSEPDKKIAVAIECDEKMRDALISLSSGGAS